MKHGSIPPVFGSRGVCVASYGRRCADIRKFDSLIRQIVMADSGRSGTADGRSTRKRYYVFRHSFGKRDIGVIWNSLRAGRNPVRLPIREQKRAQFRRFPTSRCILLLFVEVPSALLGVFWRLTG